MTVVAIPTASAPWATFVPTVVGYKPLTISIPTAANPWTTFAPIVVTEEIAGNDKVAIPPANVPLAYFMMDGKRVPVYIDPTWYKYENNLYQRTGGPSDAVALAENGVSEAISVASTAAYQVSIVQLQVNQQQSEIQQINGQVAILDERVTEIEP